MTIQAFCTHLRSLAELNILLPGGHFMPRHFHITEVGLQSRHFIDCGGTVRLQQVVLMQAWVAKDFDHRLSPEKLLSIIHQAQALWGDRNPDVQIEYQGQTIERYAVLADGLGFQLQALQTDCLAQDRCGVADSSSAVAKAVTGNSCTPGSGCC